MASLSASEWQALIPEAGDDLPPLLEAGVSVARRQTYGGTGFAQVAAQRGRAEAELAGFRETLSAIPIPIVEL